MLINFRNFENTAIAEHFNKMKDELFEFQGSNQYMTTLDELETLFEQEFSANNTSKTYYGLALQALIYFVSHLKNTSIDTSAHRKELINELLNRLESVYTEGAFWEDEQEGVNLLHALAHSSYELSEFLPRVYHLFKADLPEMLVQQDKHGFTALHSAFKEGKVLTSLSLMNISKNQLTPETYQQLLSCPNNNGFSAFSSAYHTPALLEKIYQETEGLDVNQRSDKGYTALFNAAKNCKRESALWLVNHGADYVSLNDKSPLAIAIIQGHLQIIKVFLQKMIEDKLDTESIVELLQYLTREGCELTLVLQAKNYTLIDRFIERAAKRMNLLDFNEYTKDIFWGQDDRALTNLLYQAKENFPPDDLKRFINKKSPYPEKKGKTLLEICSPDIAARISRYTGNARPVNLRSRQGQAPYGRFFSPRANNNHPRIEIKEPIVAVDI